MSFRFFLSGVRVVAGEAEDPYTASYLFEYEEENKMKVMSKLLLMIYWFK